MNHPSQETSRKRRRHLCLINRYCWEMHRHYGMPMRYYGKRFRFTIIPGRNVIEGKPFRGKQE